MSFERRSIANTNANGEHQKIIMDFVAGRVNSRFVERKYKSQTQFVAESRLF
jgi:hypothetical protein